MFLPQPINKPLIDKMTTTLLLAYSGGYTSMLMFYMGQGTFQRL
jgi:hypothetical protein